MCFGCVCVTLSLSLTHTLDCWHVPGRNCGEFGRGLQGIAKGDFSSFKEDAAVNAKAVTPVGALMVRKMTA